VTAFVAGPLRSALVTSPIPSAQQDFDLAAEARRIDRNRARARVILGSVAGLFVVLGAVAFFSALTEFTRLYTAGLLWFLAAYFVAMMILRRPKSPLSGLQITPDGVSLTFEDGSSSVLRWDDPAFGLTLRDYSPDLGATKAEKQHVVLLAPGRRSGTVQQDVARALADAARQHALPVVERTEAVRSGRLVHQTLTTRIGRLEGTPDWRGR
jgi:hypothetical protein